MRASGRRIPAMSSPSSETISPRSPSILTVMRTSMASIFWSSASTRRSSRPYIDPPPPACGISCEVLRSAGAHEREEERSTHIQ
jgi:hypothetical protein